MSLGPCAEKFNIVSKTMDASTSAISLFEQIWSKKKIRMVSLSWNLVPRRIGICRIQWYCLLFLFKTGNTLFWANLVQKLKIVSLSWNLVLRPHVLVDIIKVSRWWCPLERADEYRVIQEIISHLSRFLKND